MRLGHVVDGEAQVVVAVFEEQDVRLVDQSPPQLSLHLHHFLQSNAEQHSGSVHGISVPFPECHFKVTPRTKVNTASKGVAAVKNQAKLLLKRSVFVHQRSA